MDELNNMSKTETLVCKLMNEYSGAGHHLFVDNYYTSVALCYYLKKNIFKNKNGASRHGLLPVGT